MNMDLNINGIHYLIKNDSNKEIDKLKKWIYINLQINNYKTNMERIELILNEIIYDIKVINDEVLKKRILKYVPDVFLKYKKYNKLYPDIV